MRCNPETHPLLALSQHLSWTPQYSTRLRGYFEFEPRKDVEQAFSANVQVRGHDDWDCLNDLEAAGYLEVVKLTEGLVKIEPKGCELVGAIRTWLALGNPMNTFQFEVEPASAA